MWLALLAVLLTILYVVPAQPKPILGIYNQPGKWFYLKASFIYISIVLRKWRASRSGGTGVRQSGMGVRSAKDLLTLEQAQPLSDNRLAVDAVLFSCAGRDGSYLVAAQARRKLMMNNTIFCLRIPKIGVLVHPKHPDTTFFTDVEATWSAGDLKLDMVEPMKRWRISYEGAMINQETRSTHDVILTAEYKSDLPYFDFDSDMDPWTAARAFAKEPWSKEYFERIRMAHQSHYEQFGDLRGVVKVDSDTFELDLNVMRDHTHGSNRDWRLMHRYGIQNFRTANGFRGFCGVVSQPSTFTALELGYVYTPDGRCLPIQAVDLPLWAHGEGGHDQPKSFGFRFKAGGQWHDIQVKVLDLVEVRMGWQWEARVVERFCEFTVDGVPGWGISEWHWRAYGGRPKALEETDPPHTKDVEKY